MKKWLSRGIVLAMVVALMVPMPVMAKSSKKGGKLIKEVTYYDYNYGKDGKYGTADDKYVPQNKTAFKYDKKKNPSERKRTSYDANDLFLNVPVSGTVTTETYKYKYKGKTPKSMTVRNEVGFVTETNKYTKGKVSNYSGVYYVYTGEGKDGVEREYNAKYSGSVAYGKNGIPTASCYVYGETEAGAYAGGSESNTVLYTVQKKGIPSYMFATGNWKRFDKNGAVTEQSSSDGSGVYATFNNKGLLVQEGWYDAKKNKYFPDINVQYVMKKGNVAEAIVLGVYNTYDEEGNIIKSEEKAYGKYVFKYSKTKISKQRYMNMINSFVEHEADSELGCFFWY